MYVINCFDESVNTATVKSSTFEFIAQHDFILALIVDRISDPYLAGRDGDLVGIGVLLSTRSFFARGLTACSEG